MLVSALCAGLAVGLYFARDGKSPGFDRNTDLLVHDAALIALREHTQLMTPGLAAVSKQNPRLRLVAIDEISLRDAQHDALGQFRVPRSQYARLIKRLEAGGVKAVGFDLQFAAAASDLGQDKLFAAALRTMPSVLSYSLSDGEAGPVAANLASAADVGFIPVHNESGPIVSQELSAGTYRAFAAVAAARYLRTDFTPVDGWHARLGNTIVPLDGHGRLLLLPFETDATTPVEQSTGAPAQWIDFAPTIELSDALRLSDDELRELFADSLVIVGPTAHGVADFVDTPKGRLPVVFSTMRMIDQLISGSFVKRAPVALDLALIIIAAVVVGAAGVALAPFSLAGVSVLLLGGYSAIAISVFAVDLYWIDIIHVDIAILATTLGAGIMRGSLESGARQRVTEIFEKHTSPEVVHDILDAEATGSDSLVVGKRAVVTIFYSDIRGFTALAEELAPELIYNALNEYFEEMCSIVFRYGGYIDKFMGDAMMAIFSAPTQTPHDAHAAVHAALEQQARLKELNVIWAAAGRPTFEVGNGHQHGRRRHGLPRLSRPPNLYRHRRRGETSHHAFKIMPGADRSSSERVPNALFTEHSLHASCGV